MSVEQDETPATTEGPIYSACCNRELRDGRCPACGQTQEALAPATTKPSDGTRLPIVGRTIRFLYRDRGGEESDRTVIPGEIRFGPCAGHSDPQWVMRAYDVDMGAYRNFAMQNMQEVQDV